jgi:beta-lactam-binding protein with PASTA domain
MGTCRVIALCLVLASVGCGSTEEERLSERVRVPDVVGMEENAALRRITRADLCVQDISYLARPAEPDVVVEQWPKAGALVTQKLRMALFVSAAPAGIWTSSKTLGDCPPTYYIPRFPVAGETP